MTNFKDFKLLVWFDLIYRGKEKKKRKLSNRNSCKNDETKLIFKLIELVVGLLDFHMQSRVGILWVKDEDWATKVG